MTAFGKSGHSEVAEKGPNWLGWATASECASKV